MSEEMKSLKKSRVPLKESRRLDKPAPISEDTIDVVDDEVYDDRQFYSTLLKVSE
jgi:hypothetical protein